MSGEVKGFDELARRVEEITGRLQNPSRVDRPLAEIFRRRIAERFDRQGEGDWPALAARTVDLKRRRGQDSRMMRATGALYAALTAGQAHASATTVTYKPGTTVGRYAYIVPRRRPILSRNEGRLVTQVAETLGQYAIQGDT